MADAGVSGPLTAGSTVAPFADVSADVSAGVAVVEPDITVGTATAPIADATTDVMVIGPVRIVGLTVTPIADAGVSESDPNTTVGPIVDACVSGH